jgi:hypothetical protein
MMLVDLSLRGVGFALFLALTVQNRRAMGEEKKKEEAATPTA